MTTPHRKQLPRQQDAPAQTVVPVAEWAWLLCQPLFEAQRLQWDAYLGWQQSIATLSKDFWDQWAVRFGGGLPIDG